MNPRLAEACTAIGVIAILVSALLRTVVSVDPVPVWSMDPLAMWVPPSGIGPVALLTLDLLGLLGAAMTVAAAGRRLRWTTIGLLLVAAAAITFHAARDPADAEIGMPWIFALASGVALAHLPRESIWRAAALASILSVAVLLVGRGALQVFIEHPQTVASYEATKASFLESQGWSADSVMARSYERRLRQPEASGWFGLSNVFGSVMAAITLALAVLGGAIARHADDRRVPMVLLLAATLTAAGLALSASKGAAGSMVLAILALALAARLPGRARLVAALVPTTVLLGVVARGLIGERIGELSVLFRWFYMEGATRIFLDHPLVGVGPAGFKDAYLLAKPPTSPEEVTSAHNLVFDWLATMGLPALACIGLVALACRGIGMTLERLHHEPAESPSWDPRTATLISAGVLAVMIGASAFVERVLLTPEMGVVRAIGLLGGPAVAAATVRAAKHHPRAVSAAAAAAALVLLAHTQFEVTGVWAGSAPLAGCLIGLAASPPRPRSALAGRVGAAGLVGAAAIVAATSGRSIALWDAAMDRATTAVEPIGSLISVLQTAEPQSPELFAAVEAIGDLTDEPTARNDEQLRGQVERARAMAIDGALPHLVEAARLRPSHEPTRQQAVRMTLRGALLVPGQDRDARLDEAVRLARAGVDAAPGSAGAWRLLALASQSAADQGGQARRTERLEAAFEAALQAAALDPHGLPVSLNLVDLADRLGLLEARQAWSRRALEIDADLRLDPLKRLTDLERVRLERLAADD